MDEGTQRDVAIVVRRVTMQEHVLIPKIETKRCGEKRRKQPRMMKWKLNEWPRGSFFLSILFLFENVHNCD